MIVKGSITLKDEASVPPKRTVEAPLKFNPDIVIVVPENPLAGVNELITGGPAN
jgi:hypothetical protein